VGVSAVVCMYVWTSGAAGHHMRILSDKRPTCRSNSESALACWGQSPTSKRAISNILARLTQACLRAASNILARLTQTSCEQSACLRAVSNTSARQTQTSCEQSQACLRAVSNILASRAALSLACLDSTSSCSAVQVISTFSPRFVMHFSLVDSQPINKS
jgi:hypothetical protein